MEHATLELEATAFTPQQIIINEEPQFAFVGRSNVGKSSLINALAGRKQLARVSATPGKTRSVNIFKVIPDGFHLVDLPGYGYAKGSKTDRESWGQLIEYYLQNTRGIKALVLLLDSRLPPQNNDIDMAHYARSLNIPILPVLTKTDKCKRQEILTQQRAWTALLDGAIPLPVSTKDRVGVEALWTQMRERIAEFDATVRE